MFYPDFTILHPLTGKEIYWEHFGKMDLPEYAKNAADKLHMYARNGIYPGDRLITTYETMEQPLDTAIVQKLITYHLNNSERQEMRVFCSGNLYTGYVDKQISII